jgi:hypothetical protein
VGVSVGEVDIPFELVGEVASAGAVAEAGHVKGGAAARHCRVAKDVLLEDYNKRNRWNSFKKCAERIGIDGKRLMMV